MYNTHTHRQAIGNLLLFPFSMCYLHNFFIMDCFSLRPPSPPFLCVDTFSCGSHYVAELCLSTNYQLIVFGFQLHSSTRFILIFLVVYFGDLPCNIFSSSSSTTTGLCIAIYIQYLLQFSFLRSVWYPRSFNTVFFVPDYKN